MNQDNELGEQAAFLRRDSSVQDVDFSQLFHLHWNRVFRICLRITENRHDAEDAAQDCFLRAFSRSSQFKGNAQFTTWLSSIAINCSLMLLRKRRNKPEMPIEIWRDSTDDVMAFNPVDGRPDQLRYVLDKESRRVLRQAITALPLTLRSAGHLAMLDERTLEEVSRLLNISYAGAKSRLYRARRHVSQSYHRHFRFSESNQRPGI